jgi:hypothetical protein
VAVSSALNGQLGEQEPEVIADGGTTAMMVSPWRPVK